MNLRRTAIVAGVAVLAATAMLAVGAGVTIARVTKIGSSVTINFQAGTYADKFFGKVKSSTAACKKKRKVKVFRKKTGPDKLFGSDNTNKKGKYTVAPGAKAKAGKYYAKATKKTLSNNRICKPATSKRISVP